MVLNISELLKKKIEILPFDISFDCEVIKRDDFELILKSPIAIIGEAVYNDEIVNLRGNISGMVEAQCSRCLQKFDYFINTDFDENFSKFEHDEDYYPITGGEIDLEDMVIDNLILAMPLRLICSDDCKGLCPSCGENLNKGKCSCEKDLINPKFAALKDLFKED